MGRIDKVREARWRGAGRILWLATAVALLSAAGEATAALTAPSCIAKKLKEWGKLRKCQSAEDGKAIEAKPADPAKCQAKFAAKLAALDGLATAAGIPCRYRGNGDGTVTDYDTGLMWEQKTDDDSVHDMDAQYTWSDGGNGFAAPDGTVFTIFLAGLNDCASADGEDVAGGFAGHCDWRLPSKSELSGIVDGAAPGCGVGSACIDQTLFGPTGAFYHWSGTRDADSADNAWFVDFSEVGGGNIQHKSIPYAARAVRSAL